MELEVPLISIGQIRFRQKDFYLIFLLSEQEDRPSPYVIYRQQNLAVPLFCDYQELFDYAQNNIFMGKKLEESDIEPFTEGDGRIDLDKISTWISLSDPFHPDGFPSYGAILSAWSFFIDFTYSIRSPFDVYNILKIALPSKVLKNRYFKKRRKWARQLWRMLWKKEDYRRRHIKVYSKLFAVAFSTFHNYAYIYGQ